MQLKTTILFCCLLAAIGCSKEEQPPPLYSSATFVLDGTHQIPKIGAPTSSSILHLVSKIPATTPPLALPNADTETFVIAQGTDIIIGSPRSSRILTHSTDSSNIVELLADSSAIYAIHLNGTLESYTREGKLQWHSNVAAFPKSGAVLFNGEMLIATDSAITALNCRDGLLRWKYITTLAPISLCIDWKKSLILAAVSANNPISSDSIICFKPDGSIASRIGFAKMRITSNLCIAGENISFGYLSGADTSANRKSAHIGVWAITDHVQKWQQTLPYIVSSVSFTGSLVLSGGFRETEGEIVSGIDAFHIDDSAMVWRRRFSYPLVSTITVSASYAYIPFTFSTQATVSTKTVVSIIDLSDGKTHSELNITGAETGFVQGIGMPIEGMLTYADRSLAQVYFLKP